MFGGYDGGILYSLLLAGHAISAISAGSYRRSPDKVAEKPEKKRDCEGSICDSSIGCNAIYFHVTETGLMRHTSPPNRKKRGFAPPRRAET